MYSYVPFLINSPHLDFYLLEDLQIVVSSRTVTMKVSIPTPSWLLVSVYGSSIVGLGFDPGYRHS